MFFKKKMKKKLILTYIIALIFILGSIFLLNKVFWQDLMEQAFVPAMSYDTVVKLWNTKDAVWNTILRESMTVEMWESVFKKACFVNNQIQNGVTEDVCVEMWWERRNDVINVSAKAPLIVRITKFLLRMTIVLSITMIIFNSIKYMIEVMNWKDWKSAEAKKNLVFVAGWIILALMSVSIINLVVSVPKSSLKTSDDLSSFEIWCKVWTEIIAGNDLKKYICENVDFWKPQNTMNYRIWEYIKPFWMSSDNMDDRFLWWYRCKICENERNDCYRKKLTNKDIEQNCVQDLWWTIVK